MNKVQGIKEQINWSMKISGVSLIIRDKICPKKGLTLILIGLLITACSGGGGVDTTSSTFTDNPGSPVVTMAGGSVRGAGTEILSFKGIPYAKPPVGALRWTAPVAPDIWTATRDATNFGLQCIQNGTAPMSEDCLFINVWTPKTALVSASKLPVMVWVYGGSFTGGNGNIDGTPVAKAGAVVVSMNYRVSTLGFMAHPQLSAESADKVSGNYGIQDIAQSLKWVKANIERFGGDPTKVTIWGQSSGASAVTALMSSPRSAGLFQRAILQSAGAWRHWKTLQTAEQDGLAVGTSIAALRALPVAQIPVILNLGGGSAIRALAEPRVIGPTMDGVILPHQERLAYETGSSTSVPVIVGNNTDEGYSFTNGYLISTIAGYKAYLKDPNIYGSFGEIASSIYPVNSDAEVKSAISLSFGDNQFWFGMRGIARVYTNSRNMPVYRYYFTRKQNGGTGSDAVHGNEIPYVFADSKLSSAPYIADDVKISNAMLDAWVRFASTGDPNGGLITNWPRYNTVTEPVYQFDTTFKVVNGPRNSQLDFVQWFDSSIPAN